MPFFDEELEELLDALDVLESFLGGSPVDFAFEIGFVDDEIATAVGFAVSSTSAVASSSVLIVSEELLLSVLRRL